MARKVLQVISIICMLILSLAVYAKLLLSVFIVNESIKGTESNEISKAVMTYFKFGTYFKSGSNFLGYDVLVLSIGSVFAMIGAFRFACKDSTYYKFPSKIILAVSAVFLCALSLIINHKFIMDEEEVYMKNDAGRKILFFVDVGIGSGAIITAILAWFSCPNNDEEFESENCWNSFFYSIGIFLFAVLTVGDFAMYLCYNDNTMFLFSAASNIFALAISIIHPFVVPVSWSSKVISGASRLGLAISSAFAIAYMIQIIQSENKEWLTPKLIVPCISTFLSPLASMVSSLSAVSAEEFPKSRSSFV